MPEDELLPVSWRVGSCDDFCVAYKRSCYCIACAIPSRTITDCGCMATFPALHVYLLMRLTVCSTHEALDTIDATSVSLGSRHTRSERLFADSSEDVIILSSDETRSPIATLCSNIPAKWRQRRESEEREFTQRIVMCYPHVYRGAEMRERTRSASCQAKRLPKDPQHETRQRIGSYFPPRLASPFLSSTISLFFSTLNERVLAFDEIQWNQIPFSFAPSIQSACPARRRPRYRRLDLDRILRLPLPLHVLSAP